MFPIYRGFLNQVGYKSEWTAFLIPLDMFALGIMVDHPAKTHALHGHLHYFSKSTALESLEDSGYEIVDWFYAKLGWERPVHGGHRLLKYPRRLLFALAPDMAVRLLGGCSLVVLAKFRKK